MPTEQCSLSQSDKFLTEWLSGALFVGFRFASNFTLYFDLQNEVHFEGQKLPWTFRLEILEDWWFGDKDEWLQKVSEKGESVQPDEPVKAFELAKLRWSGGVMVESISVNEKILTIVFENNIELHVQQTSEDEFAYSLSDYSDSSSDCSWSLTLDSVGFYLRKP